MATIPSIASVVSGQRFRATMYNAIKAFLDFLIDTPHCEVWDAAGFTFTAGTAKIILFNTETSDTDSMHSTVSNTGRIVFNTAGRFDLNIFINMPSNTYSQYEINLRLNSGGSAAGGSSIRTWVNDHSAEDWAVSLSRVFGSGDYVEVFCTITPGGTSAGSGGLYGTGVQARFIALN